MNFFYLFTLHIQYSYNSEVSILLVSLLSRASGSLRTTLFHFFRNVFTLVQLVLSKIFLFLLLLTSLLSLISDCISMTEVLLLVPSPPTTFNVKTEYDRHGRIKLISIDFTGVHVVS